MKKQITCPVCDGRGFVSWINNTKETCSTGSKTCTHCNGTGLREVDFTNADHIRSMTDEELAQFLDDTQYREWEAIQESRRELLEFDSCVDGWVAWLKRPYREKGQNE